MTTQSASFTQLLQLPQLLPHHYRSDCFVTFRTRHPFPKTVDVFRGLCYAPFAKCPAIA